MDRKPSYRNPAAVLRKFLAQWTITDAEIDYLKHMGYTTIEDMLEKQHFTYDAFEGRWKRHICGVAAKRRN